ncbi:MAG TPA: DNA-3-methyladenine glycosylase I [Thermoanaerobaculia bacterium]|nr:DNA-3-methyladenine glycosylase I [Thermoanaerobaculia bacterium]
MKKPTAPRTRCFWVSDDPLYISYHDDEWGVPVHDERRLFEMLILEGAQAGLSWITILRRREGYRQAFDGFDPKVIARYGPAEIAARLTDPGIVRNRAKVEATVQNARTLLELRDQGESLDGLLWSFVGGRPRQNRWSGRGEVPAETAESKAMSKELRRRGFTFVGPTICYAFMQAVGMVNDHTVDCFRHHEVGRLA